VGIDGVGTYTCLRFFHEFAKENEGKELALEVFRSLLAIDAEDVEVSILHVIFDLKGVFVGKDYFRINHLLPPLFNLVQGPTLLGNNVVPKPTLK
jgi:hypothetical protein